MKLSTILLFLASTILPAFAAAQVVKPSAIYAGFDDNEYPGDAALAVLKKHFAFAGYWLTIPPGDDHNGWTGKRTIIRQNGFGFLVLANGRMESEIKKSVRNGTSPATLGVEDATKAAFTARSEGFPAHTILFLDQEEGGRLSDAQMAYLLAWTEAIARAGFLPGVYASGQPVPDSPGVTITTIQNIRHSVAEKHLHEIAFWVYQDACPPAPGCTMQPPALALNGTPDVVAWQYAQSPRRKNITQSCAKTYAPDGNCYAPDLPGHVLDLSVAASADPSHGR